MGPWCGAVCFQEVLKSLLQANPQPYWYLQNQQQGGGRAPRGPGGPISLEVEVGCCSVGQTPQAVCCLPPPPATAAARCSRLVPALPPASCLAHRHSLPSPNVVGRAPTPTRTCLAPGPQGAAQELEALVTDLLGAGFQVAGAFMREAE